MPMKLLDTYNPLRAETSCRRRVSNLHGPRLVTFHRNPGPGAHEVRWRFLEKQLASIVESFIILSIFRV